MRNLRRAFDPTAAWRAAAHVRARRYVAALTAVAPGVLDISRRFGFLDVGRRDVDGVPWRMVAAERTGARRVLTRHEAPISIAVAASCAIPGVFAPVMVGGRRLVDGGVHSTTNADLAVSDGSALVVVVAPMCGEAADGTSTAFRRDLDREVATLRDAGRRVVVFGPSAQLQVRMGRNPLAGARSREITGRALLEAVDGLREIGPSRRVAGLARATHSSAV